jgi:hypothetical protein
MPDEKEEITSAIEEARDSLEERVEELEIPETVEQILEHAYENHVHYRAEEENAEHPYNQYETRYSAEEDYSAGQQAADSEKEAFENAEAMIENARSERLLGLGDANFHVTEEQTASVNEFKAMHLGEWFIMCANPALYVLS